MRIQLVGNSVAFDVSSETVRVTSYGIEYSGDQSLTDHGRSFVPWTQVEELWFEEGETLDDHAEGLWQAIVDLNKKIHAMETELRRLSGSVSV